MSPLPPTLGEDSVDDTVEKRHIDEDHGVENGADSDQNGFNDEDPWWRTFKLWKVNMRGLADDDTS
jgi:hypothetical protein